MPGQTTQPQFWIDKYNVRVPVPRKLNLGDLAFGAHDAYALIGNCLSEPSEIVMGRLARDTSRIFWYYLLLDQPVQSESYIVVEIRYSRDPGTGNVIARLHSKPTLRDTIDLPKGSTRWREEQITATTVDIAAEAERLLRGTMPEQAVRDRWESGQETQDAVRKGLEIPPQQVGNAEASIDPDAGPAQSSAAPLLTVPGIASAQVQLPAEAPTQNFDRITSPILGEIRLGQNTWEMAARVFGIQPDAKTRIIRRLSGKAGPDSTYDADPEDKSDRFRNTRRYLFSQVYQFHGADGEQRQYHLQVIVTHHAALSFCSVFAILAVPVDAKVLSDLKDRRGIPVAWGIKNWNQHVCKHLEISRLYTLDREKRGLHGDSVFQAMLEKPRIIVHNVELEKRIRSGLEGGSKREPGRCYDLTPVPGVVSTSPEEYIAEDGQHKSRQIRICLEYRWTTQDGNSADIKSVHYWSARWEQRVKGENQVWLLA